MNAPYISVLIDTYNSGRFIEETIDSVLSQDFPADRLELLVVDDGSTDDTAQRAAKYGSAIQYFCKPNGGQASAFNFGVAKCRGEIVALLDGDDLWLPGKLRRIADAFGEHPETGMIYHHLLELHDATGNTTPSLFVPLAGYLPDAHLDLLRYFPYPTSCLSFRRKILDQLLPVPEALKVQADGYLGLTTVFAAPVLGIPECLGMYRIHGNNFHYDDEATKAPRRRREQIALRHAMLDGTFAWLTAHGHDLKRPATRSFFGQWGLYQKKEHFKLQPPGRIKFFFFVLFEISTSAPIQARKLTAFNYLMAPLALAFGYQRAHRMYEWRGKALAKVARMYRAFFPAPRGPSRTGENNGHSIS